jgi:hypothetical protein
MDQDLIDLIAACRGDGLDPSRREELLTRLRRDEAFQQAFVDELRMLGMLKAVQSMEPRWLRLHDELGWGPGARPPEEDREEQLLRRIQDLAVPSRRRPGRWVRCAAATAAAVLLIGLAATLWAGRARRRVADVPDPPRPYPRVDVESALAMVVGLDRVKWEADDEPHPAEGDLVPPSRLRLRSGRATLSLLSGAVLIVEGPADLDLVAIDRVFCRRGKLRTRVPKGAEGLVISSPASAVIDLGTEFGLNVEPGGASRVAVFEGMAQAVMYTGSGHENLSEFARPDRALELDPGAGRIRAVEPSADFTAPLDLPTPLLDLDPGYPGAVRAARPWGYWRFESLRAGAVPNEVAGGPPLRATGPIHLGGAPGGNQAAVFRAGEGLQYLELEGPWRPSSGDGYAVELWFLPESIAHAALVAMTSPRDTNHHFLILETGARTRYALHPPASVRFLDRWPPGMEGGHNIYSKTTYVPYRWHHLVGQMNGGRMELYLDGEPVYSQSAGLGHPTTPCQVVLGRLSSVPLTAREDSRWLFGRPFAGRLDEVAFYDHPLSIEEIRRHHRLATARVRDARSAARGRAPEG